MLPAVTNSDLHREQAHLALAGQLAPLAPQE
jgi:hypothetical protein